MTDDNYMENAPPSWSGTVRAMKINHPELFKGKGKNPYALSWYMYKKGNKPHYQEMKNKDSRKGTPHKKKKYKNESLKSFASWKYDNDIKKILGDQYEVFVETFNSLDVENMDIMELAEKIKETNQQLGIHPLLYAEMMKIRLKK